MKVRRRYLNAREVRESLGGICDMTLRRWIKYRGFPKPIICGRLRLWDEPEIPIWVEAQRQAAPIEDPAKRPEINPGSEFAKKAGDAVGRAE